MPLKQSLKRLMRGFFEVGQKFGVDVLPRHFYSEIPDMARLRASSTWRKPFDFSHIAGSDIASQQAFAAACTHGLQSMLTASSIHQRALQMNHLPEGFGVIEADFLYCFIRSQRPARIMQVGCGVSTAVCMLAAADAGYKLEILCIEPYPNQFLIEQAAAGNLCLVKERFEETAVPIADFLQSGDLFFVDSSHCLGPAGEVTRIICGTLPMLAAGVWVHFHDIQFPYDYSGDTLRGGLFFHHESALLQAFLLMNKKYSIAVSLSMMHHCCPEQLLQWLPNYRPARFEQGLRLSDGHYPTSTYLRVG